jgi:hypothetical protein
MFPSAPDERLRAEIFQLCPVCVDGGDAQVGAAEIHADGQILHGAYLAPGIILKRFNKTSECSRSCLRNGKRKYLAIHVPCGYA